LLQRNLDAALRFTLIDELNVVLLDQLLLAAIDLKLLNLLFLRLVVLYLLLEFRALIRAVLQEHLLFLNRELKLIELISVLVLGSSSFTALVGHNDQSNNVKLLLVNTVLEEQTFFIECQEFLLELVLNVDDVASDVL
jgi:hypothetical protein